MRSTAVISEIPLVSLRLDEASYNFFKTISCTDLFDSVVPIIMKENKRYSPRRSCPLRASQVEVEVPSSWGADNVRFKWKQENFENAFEYWALDDVRVSAERGGGRREWCAKMVHETRLE